MELAVHSILQIKISKFYITVMWSLIAHLMFRWLGFFYSHFIRKSHPGWCTSPKSNSIRATSLSLKVIWLYALIIVCCFTSSLGFVPSRWCLSWSPKDFDAPAAAWDVPALAATCTPSNCRQGRKSLHVVRQWLIHATSPRNKEAANEFWFCKSLSCWRNKMKHKQSDVFSNCMSLLWVVSGLNWQGVGASASPRCLQLLFINISALAINHPSVLQSSSPYPPLLGKPVSYKHFHPQVV